jgi:hypothetical protein
MRAISYRIRRLEKIVASPVPEEGESAADILRARRRRRLEAAGLPFEDERRISWTLSECRRVSLTDVLSGRYCTGGLWTMESLNTEAAEGVPQFYAARLTVDASSGNSR